MWDYSNLGLANNVYISRYFKYFMNKYEVKRLKILILIYPIIASIVSLIVKASFFDSIIIFFFIPSLILSFYNKHFIKKITLFSVILSIPIVMVVDYIMHLTGGWFVYSTIFASRFLGYVPFEDFIWGFFYVYFVLMFYETFLDKHCKPNLYYPKLKYLVILFLLFIGIFLYVYAREPRFLNISYFYLKFGVFLVIIPISFLILKFPKLYAKIFKIGVYFFYITLLHELTSLQLGQWGFPKENQLIFIINLFGLRFPFEELFFFIMLCAIAILSYYEFFDENTKSIS